MRDYVASRGLGEEIARAFRLGLSRGTGLVAKARERGFTDEEIRAAGLANARGNDYFPFRLMFPLADARGRIVGFQARKLRDDDPLRGKYVNTPEGELFKKGNVLYGLHLARPAVAKQDRAIVVEGNTDVIALRQAGVEPVVASMGTALTESQLARARPAHEAPLPLLRRRRGGPGGDPARDGAGRAARGSTCGSSRCRRARTPPTRRTRSRRASAGPRATSSTGCGIELERTDDRQEAFVRAREILARAEDSPERQEALRLLADRLDLPRETLAGLAAARPPGERARPRSTSRRRACWRRGSSASGTCSPPSSATRRSCRSSPRSRLTTSLTACIAASAKP